MQVKKPRTVDDTGKKLNLTATCNTCGKPCTFNATRCELCAKPNRKPQRTDLLTTK